jgi:hypothetical protein
VATGSIPFHAALPFTHNAMIREVRIIALVRKCFVDYSLPARAVKLGTSRTRELSPHRKRPSDFPSPFRGGAGEGLFNQLPALAFGAAEKTVMRRSIKNCRHPKT